MEANTGKNIDQPAKCTCSRTAENTYDGPTCCKKRNKWDKWADRINKFRVFPRLAIVLYGLLTYQVVDYALTHPEAEYARSGLAGVVTGAFSAALASYMSTGTKKNGTNE